MVALWESGDVLVQLPATSNRQRRDLVIEGDIAEALQASIAFVA